MTFEQEELKRKEGYDYYDGDKSTYDNPYPKDSEEFVWWNIGFLDAFNESYELYMS